ncbi:MAG TPA: hypothetical protein VFS97_13510 [Nitrososphaeraceae archaeon]|nr:hypothetical protein [Nitrososphaeraceae archaeon]
MNTKRFTISITAGIAVMLLLIGGTGAGKHKTKINAKIVDDEYESE